MTAPVVLAVADAAAGCSLAAGGVLTRRRRPASWAGWIMLGASGCWFAGNLVPAAAYLHRGPLVHLLLGHPTGRLHRALSIAAVPTVYVAAAVDALARDPWITAGVALVVALTALEGFVWSAGPRRKAAVPALVAALGFAAVLAVAALDRQLRWERDLAIAVAYDLVVTGVVVLLTTDLLRGRWTDATLTDLVTGLGTEADAFGVPGLLRRAVGDPSLEIGYWMPDQGRYVNERGQPLDIGAASQRRAVTRIDENGKSLAVLLHDAAALDDPDLMAGVVTAARLAVDNARMNAALGARVVDLNASRRRIVEATDAQRRRLERDLARGAAARLDDAAESLRTYGAAKASVEIDALIAELEGTRRDLHEFAQGIRPRKLSAGGLAEALPFLASRSPIPVVLQVDPGRHPPAIESSLYFVCSEALTNAAKHSQATHIDVVVTHGEGIVEVTIRDDGVGGAELSGHGLRGMADRVHALGGTISIDPVGGGGTNIRVRLPTAPGSSMDPA